MKRQEGMGKRIVAGLIDMGVTAVVAAIFMFSAASIAGKEIRNYAIIFPILLFFYMAVMDLTNDGQTLGRKIVKEQVVGKNGKRPSAVDFVVRNLVKTMPILIIVMFPNIWIITIVIAGIYFLVPFINKGYAIHDMVGATTVNTCKSDKRDEGDENVSGEVKEEKKVATREQEPVPGLYGVSGMYEDTFIPLTRKVTLGRSTTCNLVFEEDAPRISRRHCSVAYREADDTYILTDLESSYGTFLEDGSRIPAGKAVLLEEGEVFSLGQSEQFRVGKKL